jgi:hypothetical protein
MAETYVLLWSKRSNNFHIEQIKYTVESGMYMFRQNSGNDFLLIGFGTLDEMSAKADELRPTLHERAEVRRLYDDGSSV